MTMTKMALTVLGTVGLTAGTVLAMSEATPDPLPNTAAKPACSSCRKTESAGAPSACGKALCDAVAAKALSSAAACPGEHCHASGTSACSKGSCGSEASAAERNSAAEAPPPPAASGRIIFGAGVSSDAGAHGTIVLSAGIESGGCPEGECSAASGDCRGHKVYGVEFKSGLTPSITSRTVYVNGCQKCDAAQDATTCHAGACESASRSAGGDSVANVAATCCEAKSAGAVAALASTACSATAAETCTLSSCAACPAAGAADEIDLTLNSEPAGCCECENFCACGVCRCAAERDRHAASALPEIHPGQRFTLFDRVITGNPGPPGRVRLSSPPAYGHFAPAAFGHDIMLSAFAAPVAAPMPPSAQHRRTNRVEGTWTRSIGTQRATFTCENGRIRGAVSDSKGESEVTFAGMCSVSEDGQIFGLIDEVGGVTLPPGYTTWLIDQPFAVRFRFEDEELIVKDLRCAGFPASITIGDQSFPLTDVVREFACGRFSPGQGN